jgi:hypothetical protein
VSNLVRLEAPELADILEPAAARGCEIHALPSPSRILVFVTEPTTKRLTVYELAAEHLPGLVTVLDDLGVRHGLRESPPTA